MRAGVIEIVRLDLYGTPCNRGMKLQPNCMQNNDHQNPRSPFLGRKICSKLSAVDIFLPKSLRDQNLRQPYLLKKLLQG